MKNNLYQKMFYIIIVTVGLCFPLETKTKLPTHFFATAGTMVALGYLVHFIDQYANNSEVPTEESDIIAQPATLRETLLYFIKKYIAQPLPQVLGITNNITTIAAGSYALVS